MGASISKGQMVSVSFFLFTMFLGAGNIIFAPPLGQAAGTNTWLAMSGFLISGVGFVLLAIVALAISGGSVEKLTSRVHPKFSTVFCVLLFLTLGPIYVIPRTAAVAFEVSTMPFIPSTVPVDLVLLLFSFLFISVTIWISLNPNKFVDRLGKIITPIFLVLLFVIIATSFINPLGSFGEPQGAYTDQAFSTGFVQGYYTMDVLAAFIFGSIFINSLKNLGVKDPKTISSIFIKAGIVTVILLSLVQISLAWMGATSISILGISENGGEALTNIATLLLGSTGTILLAFVILLTGLSTAVACLAAVSEYFSRIFPKVSYSVWVFSLALMSFVITNFGLNTILELASPILLLLYPISITLIALVFINRWIKGYQSIYVGAVTGAAIMGLFDGLADIGLLPESFIALLTHLPFYTTGLGWIPIAIIGAIMGRLLGGKGKQFENQQLGMTA